MAVKKSKDSTREYIIIALLFTIPILLVTIVLVIKNNENKLIPDIFKDASENNTGNISNDKLFTCQRHGTDQDPNDLYIRYTVKTGDTLKSIAEKEMKDVSRMGDLVYINQNYYPGLSIKQPYIEVGWTLYLPPDYFTRVEMAGSVPKLLYNEYGKIVEVEDDGTWVIATDKLNPKRKVNINQQTVFYEKLWNEYKVGDCVKAVQEQMGNKTFAVYPQ